ncbi:CehA/McbA family metallohydrolase [Flavobacterium sp.]|uniref:CehA/McbA family metallohydrolase n=1 Tax=Flavobacterium sp. TaxID=239 RepID=UPI0025DE7967|nr:CehA/McbA family metallohydrolase [Flavobacterium sp.]
MRKKYAHLAIICLSYIIIFPVIAFSNGLSSFERNEKIVSNIDANCLAPVTQPTVLNFVNTTSTSFFSSFVGNNSDGYIALLSTSSTLTFLPVNGSGYAVGSILGNATVVSNGSSTSFGVYGLNPSTVYYIFIFSYNNIGCTNGPAYNITSPLSGSISTSAIPSELPTVQPTSLVFGASTVTSISGSFTSVGSYLYLVLVSTSNTLSAEPVDHSDYVVGNSIGNAKVISAGSSTSFIGTGLNSNSVYYIYVFSYTTPSCNCGNIYRTTIPLKGSIATLNQNCTIPSVQPSGLVFNNPTTTSVSGAFSACVADEYLIVYSLSSSLSALPVNGSVYNSGNTLGNATVLKRGTETSFNATNLTSGSTYYFTIFALNCSGGPIYNTSLPLKGSVIITPTTLNFYYGNFHSHSEYSDGKGLPSGDFTYGDAANCMDFLGISEHNHVSAGMSLNNWNLGRAQATSATTSTFLALYGMEWGVISTGGHVVVYGVPNLLGWDSGQYQTYVAQGDYNGTSGLFTTITNFGPNAFATLAHPNNSDFNGIMSTYSASADDAIVGTAVENGPSTSTNTTYSDPPASMAYLSFYRNMLAEGYHLGPTIDHDNHNVTHGHTATSRTVVLAYSLTESEILGAMRQMHFYASEDCSAQVTFKINNNPLGSIVTASGAPTITVTTSGSNPITSLKIYSGVPGSGTNATVLTSTTTGSISYTHTALSNSSTRYYYIDITESDGKRIITSPIWYTRNDAP